MATYTNLTDVNISSTLVVPKANITSGASVTAPTVSWTNTNANFSALANIVRDLTNIVMGL